MNQLLSESTALSVVLATGLGLFLVWIVTKKWIADTIFRSSKQAQRLVLDAERDTDTRKKEIVLAAREEAHKPQRTAEEESRIRQASAMDRERALTEEAVWLSKDSAKRVENKLQFPGQIKVTVIRETRAIDYAR